MYLKESDFYDSLLSLLVLVWPDYRISRSSVEYMFTVLSLLIIKLELEEEFMV